MPIYNNNHHIPLELAIWLAHDTYDHTDNNISTTALLRPLKQILLAERVEVDPEVDILTNFASAIGTAIHSAVEDAWIKHASKNLSLLGIPENTIKSILVNPDPTDLTSKSIPIYLERRSFKEIDGHTVSGKFDFVVNGSVKDIKSTKTYSYGKTDKYGSYIMQGSIYRWLNQDIITSDEMSILFVFTDWSAGKAAYTKGYPETPITEVKLKLISIEETEEYIREKLKQIHDLKDAPESNIPACTDKELWMDASVWKYYKNPAKTTRATKKYDSLSEATIRLIDDGSIGLIKEVKGMAKACGWCPANSICEQKHKLMQEGLLQ